MKAESEILSARVRLLVGGNSGKSESTVTADAKRDYFPNFRFPSIKKVCGCIEYYVINKPY